jgi:hypothetical protein
MKILNDMLKGVWNVTSHAFHIVPGGQEEFIEVMYSIKLRTYYMRN